MVIGGYKSLYMVIDGYTWLLVVIGVIHGHTWLKIIIGGYRCGSHFTSFGIWRELKAEMERDYALVGHVPLGQPEGVQETTAITW